MTREHWRTTGLRWLKFNAVGGIGIAVQLLVLTVLKSGLHLDYLLATALAVEAGGCPQFFYGMSDSPGRTGPQTTVSIRFLKFNLTTGLCSIAGNVLLMKFTGRDHCVAVSLRKRNCDHGFAPSSILR